MRNNRPARRVRQLLSHPRYEVMPTGSIEAKVIAHVPREVPVTVTASPAKGIGATLDLSERLLRDGYDVVPHLAARMISGRAELAEICDRLVGLGVHTVFTPAGDADPPAGQYRSALEMLKDLAALGRPFREVGITGYPESHPSIHDDITVQAMWDKRRYATHLVSNLTFDADALAAWVARIRRRGIEMPVLLGLPGPVDRAKLLAMATKIGVGESTRFLGKHRRTLTRLAAPGGFTGERFLESCAAALTAPDANVRGLHVFTFNQVEETERWRGDLLGRLGGPITAST